MDFAEIWMLSHSRSDPLDIRSYPDEAILRFEVDTFLTSILAEEGIHTGCTYILDSSFETSRRAGDTPRHIHETIFIPTETRTNDYIISSVVVPSIVTMVITNHSQYLASFLIGDRLCQ